MYNTSYFVQCTSYVYTAVFSFTAVQVSSFKYLVLRVLQAIATLTTNQSYSCVYKPVADVLRYKHRLLVRHIYLASIVHTATAVSS